MSLKNLLHLPIYLPFPAFFNPLCRSRFPPGKSYILPKELQLIFLIMQVSQQQIKLWFEKYFVLTAEGYFHWVQSSTLIFFSSRILKLSFHCFLACIFPHEQFTNNLIFVPLDNMCSPLWGGGLLLTFLFVISFPQLDYSLPWCGFCVYPVYSFQDLKVYSFH